jgi:hypothetical protein
MKKTKCSLQWKGTEACLDLWCDCGMYTHWDDSFMSQVQCPACEQVWELNPEIAVTPCSEPSAPRRFSFAPEGPGWAVEIESERDRANRIRERLGKPTIPPDLTPAED